MHVITILGRWLCSTEEDVCIWYGEMVVFKYILFSRRLIIIVNMMIIIVRMLLKYDKDISMFCDVVQTFTIYKCSWNKLYLIEECKNNVVGRFSWFGKGVTYLLISRTQFLCYIWYYSLSKTKYIKYNYRNIR